MSEPYLLYCVRLRHITWQEVELHPWMTDRPRRHTPLFVKAEAVQDDVDLPGRVRSSHVRQGIDELSSSLHVEDTVGECIGLDVLCAEHALLRVGAASTNAELLAPWHPEGSPCQKQMDVAFVLVDNIVVCFG